MATVRLCARGWWFLSILRVNRSVSSHFVVAEKPQHSIIHAKRMCYSSGSSEVNESAAKSKNEPVMFSTSKAKSQTLDDTLGAQKSNSSFPFYLGLGVLAFILYFGFIRNEDPSEAERWDIFKMNRSNEQALVEEQPMEKTTEKIHSPR